ncbi:polysaccharide pyruvyl transferase family protein [Thermopirellula anaerolimosa]
MILLHGTGTHNKGAELMAVAVLQHFRAKPNPPEFVVLGQFGPFRDRAKYGLWTLLSEKRFGRSKLVASLAHRSFRKKYGLAAEEDITAVIDASGFAFGDQHGPRPTQQMARNCRRWKRQGKKIILLPQAFGPFTTPAIRTACRELIENCDLVFAREEESYRHLVDVVGERANIKMAPDFTPLVQGILPEGFQPRNGTVFVVPNMRMLDKTDRSLAERYIPFLAEAIKGVINHDLNASLLIHTPEDRALVEPIRNACAFEIDVVEESCPLRLKGILGTAYAVISSRFHALVGALSQNVPALAVGWSHKYGQLMRDYGCPDATAEVDDLDGVRSWMESLGNAESRCALQNTLNEHNQKLRREIQRMWREVDEVLGESR